MRRLLVIDEDEFCRTGMNLRLGNLGYAIEEAGDVETARACAQARPPDVVVLDINLPLSPTPGRRTRNTTGLALARELKAQSPEMGIVLYTMHDQHLAGFMNLLDHGIRGIAYLLKYHSCNSLAATLGRVQDGRVEIDPEVCDEGQGLADLLAGQLTLHESPWVERALASLPELTPQEVRAVRCVAASYNLAGIAQALTIQRADKLLGQAYLKLGLNELPLRSRYLRQNAILIKACQIHDLRRQDARSTMI